ncbi:PREDICTED: ribosomal RNA small subunit methyltransferase NEP1 [Ipomoea nil]|uniref:ribosomal RNA small subunit methyltransferase NEP1 n=1 Tax=Ipomoea nil TaxID=35883 RepID=UPI000900B672|nr:PREDICTED: ribosomal RNA small subunit methyltransferase NEP1 [Ipomoea nil]XP_019188124.1 PREDICTED: ribosomal RNA small subunit methyltransferase NEP1 [Ipomoea nil]XP_019188126.1 PREDICTED: ribosomal RNA small subunit methyltransferase NEP1 [Ipomoea nil]XP_019188127.1 PREDICTED: ribosomal RNA small subunit methyltransferase NEP1 [Ipomoea nil]
MVRAYKLKGQKRKKKEEKYDREEIEQSSDEETAETSKKAKTEGTAADEEEAEKVVDLLAGIPVVSAEQSKKPGIIFILERASLEIAKIGKTYQLLNSDEHSNFLKRNNRNPAEYRPDIAHQAMLMILDSRLNKAGRLKALYVRTEKGVLFEVKPHVRIPRTFKRFSGIMLQLLQKLNITAVGKREKLLRVIKNPVTQYLPIDCRKIGFSHSSEKLVDIHDYVANVDSDMNLVFVVGAMAHGKIDKDYVEDYISISDYPLSAAYCISMITNALEHKWKML